jgi:Domain of unknown function (DUF4129)
VRSRSSLLLRLVTLMAVLLASVLPDSARAQNPRITDPEVERALLEVAKDPNLAKNRTIRTLDFGDDPEEPEIDRKPSGFFKWLAEFFGWVAGGARWLFWLAIIVMVALLVVYLFRMFADRRDWARAARAMAPTHVQDLDIRPESLPEDVGAVARALWDGGQQRAALSLLYRGLLSRLVHVHGVEIKQSSTEGDCLHLAAQTLTPERLEFVALLIRVWQRFVYGGAEPANETVYDLCTRFDSALSADRAAPPAPEPEPAGGVA